MFWKRKSKLPAPLEFDQKENKTREPFPYSERYCWLYISSRYEEILFVPMGKIDAWKSRELDAVVAKKWPLNIGELQDTIQETLDKWIDSVPDVNPSNDNWHSYNSSKAQTQKSFQVDYVQIRLTTDMERDYGPSELERIIVNASPQNWETDNYQLIGKSHLLETKVAQIVLDIFSACEKIRAT